MHMHPCICISMYNTKKGKVKTYKHIGLSCRPWLRRASIIKSQKQPLLLTSPTNLSSAGARFGVWRTLDPLWPPHARFPLYRSHPQNALHNTHIYSTTASSGIDPTALSVRVIVLVYTVICGFYYTLLISSCTRSLSLSFALIFTNFLVVVFLYFTLDYPIRTHSNVFGLFIDQIGPWYFE